MIDYEGVKAYLERLGFADSGINTYLTSYLHENKIDIFNNFDAYRDLSNEDKILKFSEDDSISQTEFNQYHKYAKESTFSDIKSGARRYKLYKQYQGIIKTIQKYDENPSVFETHGASWYFKVLDMENKYPVKTICRENNELLELEENFTTNQAKAKLEKIFNFRGNKTNIKFINIDDGNNLMSNKFTDEQIDIFTKIAKEKKLRYHCSSGKKYFQIYPKAVPVSEGVAGIHYEFWCYEHKAFTLEIHIEKKAKNYEALRVDVFGRKKGTRTVVERKIIDNNSIEKIFDEVYNDYEEKINNFYLNKNDAQEKVINMKQPLNKILYGPPGTGKTYNTIDKALQVIDGKVPDNRKEAKERFEVLKKIGQIEFVTFHQSYGYEEFVEGIKPCDLDNCDSENNEIKYSVQSGIFKKISKRSAQKNELIDNIDTTDFNDYLTPGQSFETKHGKKFTIAKIDEDVYFEQGKGVHKAVRKTILELLQDEDIMLNDEYYSSQVYMAREIYRQLSKNKNVSKNYILIIDEINRGNISKIFGELITLIEDSKRLGEDEVVEIILPYSGESFGVTNNLYILGTMNTADRSIALMDTALRRRFEFEEMMPKPELLSDDVEGIDLQRLLSKINLRIEYLYDRDHTIGHAYFIDVKDKIGLDSAMKNKVIPLLQEYFYDDWEKIRLVLNDGFISKVEQKPNNIFDDISDEFIDEEKYSYNIVDDFSVEAYKNIYE